MQKNKIILGLAIVVVFGSAFLLWYQLHAGKSEIKEKSITSDEPTGPSEENVETQKEDSANIPATTGEINKPVLSKSSGNAPGSSVPSGALIEFTCEGQINLDCEILLTNKSEGNRILRLGKKKIADNGIGQYFASWEWEALPGEWTVKAIVSNESNSAESDTQDLRVRHE